MTSAVRLEESVSVPHAVKDAQLHERAPATTYNPYLAARHEWDERYGSLITRERNWRLMALICAAIALVVIGGVIRLSTKTHIVPFVVAMDSLGRTMAAGPAEEASTSDDRLKRATLFTWVEDLRTVTTDGIAQRKAIDRVYAHIASGAPQKRASSETVSVEVRSV